MKLEQCDKRLQFIFRTVAKTERFLVVCSYRDQAAQDKAFSDGLTHEKWPNSKHNVWPSQAIDIAPIPLDWSDKEAFYRLGGVIVKVAAELGIPIKWGANFKTFSGDLGHYELIDELKKDDTIEEDKIA